MFCRYCGKEIKNDSVWCAHCGKSQESKMRENKGNIVETDKAVFGVISCLFFGLIGLIVGVLIYPSGSFRKRTFLKGWFVTFIIKVILIIIIIVLIDIATNSSTGSSPSSSYPRSYYY